MSNELQALLDRVAKTDPATAKDLRRHLDALSARRQFGLNFERHTPESVALTGRPISVGDKVRFLPERGQSVAESGATWIVTKLSGRKGARIAELLEPATRDQTSRPVADLVFVADFRDPIYPGLMSTGLVERGDDKPHSTVINGENYHALEALLFTNRGTVDCIYIDPPYNTRANDWKYNNDYVDPGDAYAHSKWLAFMERRLKVARELLNPADSVMIVTIDEKEFLRLGLLLEQVFPEARIQMVTSVINNRAVARMNDFSRTAEYLFFVMLGDCAPQALPLGKEWNTRGEAAKTVRGNIHWQYLRRLGLTGAVTREDRPNMFYPIFVRDDGGGVHSVGEPIPLGVEPSYESPEGTTAVWPVRANGTDGYWQIGWNNLMSLVEKGYVKAPKAQAGSIRYLKSGERSKVENGDYVIAGKENDGSIKVEPVNDLGAAPWLPGESWSISSHDAGAYGSNLVAKLIPPRKFPFPKSLYAVEDALRFFIGDKLDAVVLDFFSGSGTTAHAVMRLNHQDGGRRRTISVTNNEVSANEQRSLVEKGLRPGDPEWETLGICDFITKPRIEAAVTGVTPSGEPIQGEYKFTDEFPMADGFKENVEFFTLTYENPALVELNLAFERISPLLWMRAGSQGRIIAERTETFDVAERYAVLFSVDSAKQFLSALAGAEGVRIAYIVTDDPTQFQAISGQLPDGVESVRLYESYLRTFEINNGRA